MASGGLFNVHGAVGDNPYEGLRKSTLISISGAEAAITANSCDFRINMENLGNQFRGLVGVSVQTIAFPNTFPNVAGHNDRLQLTITEIAFPNTVHVIDYKIGVETHVSLDELLAAVTAEISGEVGSFVAGGTFGIYRTSAFPYGNRTVAFVFAPGWTWSLSTASPLVGDEMNRTLGFIIPDGVHVSTGLAGPFPANTLPTGPNDSYIISPNYADLSGHKIVYLTSTIITAGQQQLRAHGESAQFFHTLPITVPWGVVQATHFDNEASSPHFVFEHAHGIREIDLRLTDHLGKTLKLGSNHDVQIVLRVFTI